MVSLARTVRTRAEELTHPILGSKLNFATTPQYANKPPKPPSATRRAPLLASLSHSAFRSPSSRRDSLIRARRALRKCVRAEKEGTRTSNVRGSGLEAPEEDGGVRTMWNCLTRAAWWTKSPMSVLIQSGGNEGQPAFERRNERKEERERTRRSISRCRSSRTL